MKTKQEIINEIQKVLDKVAKNQSYSLMNTYKGYLKGLLFTLEVDVRKGIDIHNLINQCGLYLKFNDRLKVEKRMPEVFS